MVQVIIEVENFATTCELKLNLLSDTRTPGLPFQEKRNSSRKNGTLLVKAEAEERRFNPLGEVSGSDKN